MGGDALVTGVKVAMLTLWLPIGSQRRNCFLIKQLIGYFLFVEAVGS